MLISAWQNAWAARLYLCNEIRYWITVYTAISPSFSGDWMTIFIHLDRLISVKRLRWQFFINLMSEKFRFAEAVEMRIEKNMVASLCRLGNNVISMSLLGNSFSCMDISTFGCLIISWPHVFHSVRSEETMAAISNSVPSYDLACIIFVGNRKNYHYGAKSGKPHFGLKRERLSQKEAKNYPERTFFQTRVKRVKSSQKLFWTSKWAKLGSS